MSADLCGICGGLGWSHVTEDDGHVVARRCPECAVRQKALVTAGVPERFRGATWENWVGRDGLAASVSRLSEWRGSPWALALISESGAGNYGTGKSRALCTCVREWRIEGMRSYYVRASDVPTAERRLMDGGEDERCTARWISQYPGLIALDDLGAEHEDRSGWLSSLIEESTDARYADELPTLIASNLGRRAIAHRYPRLWRRLDEADSWLVWAGTPFKEG